MVFEKEDAGERIAAWSRQKPAKWTANVESKNQILDTVDDLKRSQKEDGSRKEEDVLSPYKTG